MKTLVSDTPKTVWIATLAVVFAGLTFIAFSAPADAKYSVPGAQEIEYSCGSETGSGVHARITRPPRPCNMSPPAQAPDEKIVRGLGMGKGLLLRVRPGPRALHVAVRAIAYG